ncbi:hypothetical protein [Candidatus Protochlamydia phocaeensis]|uniref:hypothetical protein n=1 Tax=Candidatus Protochlamydia phocaeensis TaxID=1414722 RepID=UPI0008398D32|nr:hypothetical protein [Candidatus Protochlamydia phocaeensis]
MSSLRVDNPTANPPVLPSVPPRLSMISRLHINFSQIVQPFASAIGHVFSRLNAARVFLIAQFTLKIWIAQELFYRLVYPLPFNPRSAVFTQLIASIGQEKTAIKSRLELLEDKFKQIPCLTRDLAYLLALERDISAHLKQLEDFIAITGRHIPPLPIHEEMLHLKQEYLTYKEQFNNYLDEKALDILIDFMRICNLFMQPHAPMPSSVRNDLYQDWIIVKELLVGRVWRSKIPEEFFNQMNRLEMAYHQGDELPCVFVPHQPMYLRNSDNSCYLNSSLQAIFCHPMIRERLTSHVLEDPSIAELKEDIQNFPQPLTNESERILERKKYFLAEKEDLLKKKREIQYELVKLLQGENAGRPSITYIEYILSLLYGPSIAQLRRLLANSNLHIEFNPGTLTRQLDAASAVEVLLDSILEYRGKLQRFTKTPAVPGRLFRSGNPEPTSSLHIPLIPQLRNLADLISHRFTIENRDDPDNQIIVTPAEGLIENQELADAAVLDINQEVKSAQYETWDRLVSLPDVIALHLVRFKGEVGRTTSKISSPVNLPADGIVDLSPYYDPMPGEPLDARYEITGFVSHIGSLHGGHYVAFIKKEENQSGQAAYWVCDDMANPPFRKITKDMFYSQDQPYLLILKRVHQ